MKTIRAFPPVPIDYPRMSALSAEEIEMARTYGYIADFVDPSADATRPGSDNWEQQPVSSERWSCFFLSSKALLLYWISQVVGWDRYTPGQDIGTSSTLKRSKEILNSCAVII
jgi:hypothetical protein